MKKLLIIPVLIIAMIFLVGLRFVLDKDLDYSVPLNDVIVPTFETKEIDFHQQMNDSFSLPFVASAIIDIDNDGKEELFIGGGPGQLDVIYEYKNENFQKRKNVRFEKNVLLESTFSAITLDVDGNDYSDLIVSRTNGVWLYLNDSAVFTETRLDLDLGDKTTPLSVAVTDLNRDGYFDMYVSGYIKKEFVEGQNIFNKLGYGGTSRLFINNGDNTFRDITKQSGLLDTHNTFMAIFVDVDNDGLEDLVVAQDTGHVKTWKNNGNLTFEDKINPNSEQYSYPMGIAVTDHGNNNTVDFFFSNVGSTPPRFLVTGDLREEQVANFKWIMFKNQGDFSFEDVADKVKLADYEFSWGAIFEDFNLDGRDDLVVSENYIGFPPHQLESLRLPGRFFVQTETGEFSETGELSNVINEEYGISPITADFNNDGYPDLVHINIDGHPKGFINNGGDAHFLKVKLKNTLESIGAKLKVTRSDGKILYRDYVLGEGLCSDQSHVQIFGLALSTVTQVEINYLSGKKQIRNGEFVNETLVFE